jgi:pyrroloquinoline-quinone synthase
VPQPDVALRQSGIWENPFFSRLNEGTLSLEEFRSSQEQFSFAVAFFSRPMAGLVARLPDYASRASILENVLEEHGQFRLVDSHAATFEVFLRSIA